MGRQAAVRMHKRTYVAVWLQRGVFQTVLRVDAQHAVTFRSSVLRFSFRDNRGRNPKGRAA